jgi:hypothetical protein
MRNERGLKEVKPVWFPVIEVLERTLLGWDDSGTPNAALTREMSGNARRWDI